MPAYDYVCNDCNREFTVRKSMNDNSTPECPVCESVNVSRVWSGVQLKGCGCDGSSNCGGCSKSSCSGCG